MTIDEVVEGLPEPEAIAREFQEKYGRGGISRKELHDKDRSLYERLKSYPDLIERLLPSRKGIQPFKLDRQARHRLLRDFNLGITIDELVGKYRVSRQTIFKYIGIARDARQRISSFRPQAYNWNEVVRIVLEFYSGVTKKELAKKYNVHKTTISRWAKKFKEQFGKERELGIMEARIKATAREFWENYGEKQATRTQIWAENWSLWRRMRDYDLLDRLVPIRYHNLFKRKD